MYFNICQVKRNNVNLGRIFFFFLGNGSIVAASMEVQVKPKNFPSKSVSDEFGSDVKSCCKGNAYQVLVAYIFKQNKTVCLWQNSAYIQY